MTRSSRWWLAALAVSLAACKSDDRRVALTEVPGGDPDRGRAAMVGYGCGSCHTIPGLAGANASVGPPLAEFANRLYIAGQLPNTAENLVAWLMNPQAIEPGSVMPNMNVTEADARDMGAYLATLR